MKRVLLNSEFFRPGFHDQSTINFLVSNGGIGDYVCYLSALKYISEKHPQVVGHVYAADFFIPVAKNVIKNPLWQFFDRKYLTKEVILRFPTHAPYDLPLNHTGAHSVDLGFIFYLHTSPPPPDGNWYPEIDLKEVDFPKDLVLPPRYAVLTPGANSLNRVFPVKTFNVLCGYLKSLGITPVFLGKSEITEKRKISFESGYNYEGGLNLIDKTSLLEAAKIMANANVVVGLDNGLLHLAACTSVPIIFGFNIASPLHRRPRRKKGTTFEITPDPKTLPCTFCQSQMRYIYSHDFTNCPYEDNQCLKELDEPDAWCGLVDEALLEERAV